MRKFSPAILFCLLLAPAATVLAQEEPIAYVSGGNSKELVEIFPSGPQVIFSANHGFNPQAIDLDSFGRLFICDSSNSQIHLAQLCTEVGGVCGAQDVGNWVLTTIHDRDTAESPTLEKPVGCTLVNGDLFIGESSGSGDMQGLWVMRDAAITMAPPFNPPEFLVPIAANSNDKVTEVAVAPDAAVFVTRGDEVLRAVAPYTVFLPFITGLPANATGVAVNSEREIFVAMGTIGRIDVYNPDGNLCGTYVDVSALGVRPNHMEINLKDDLLFTAPSHANGNGGDTYIALPNGGPSTPQCDDISMLPVAANPLTGTAPDGNFGIAGSGGSVSQTLSYDNSDPRAAKQCSAVFELDPEAVNVVPDCEVEVVCREMSLEEYADRTLDNFSGTTCMPIPSAGPGCHGIDIFGAECFEFPNGDPAITDIEYFFFVSQLVGAEDCACLLYSTSTEPVTQYSLNITTGYDPDPFPNDPGLRAEKLNLGSSVVAAISCPNRNPFADAGPDQTLECGASSVTIDGSASFDNDPIDQELDALMFSWSGPGIPGTYPGTEATFDVAVADLEPGENHFDLTVTDTGICPGGILSGMDSVTITLNPDLTGPTIHSITPDPATIWPPNHEMMPVTLTVDATDECGDVFCRIVDITHSDLDENGNESGNGANTSPDWLFDGQSVLIPQPINASLRSERTEGNTSVDDTRKYTIRVRCEDEVGNATCDENAPETCDAAEVLVFSDQGN